MKGISEPPYHIYNDIQHRVNPLNSVYMCACVCKHVCMQCGCTKVWQVSAAVHTV